MAIYIGFIFRGIFQPFGRKMPEGCVSGLMGIGRKGTAGRRGASNIVSL